MHNNFCGTCVHYRQHYTFIQGKLFRVYCGHCTYQKTKRKRLDAKVCENYSYVEATEDTFVTKEYLSKSLLEYLLKLELLPDIHEIGE